MSEPTNEDEIEALAEFQDFLYEGEPEEVEAGQAPYTQDEVAEVLADLVPGEVRPEGASEVIENRVPSPPSPGATPGPITDTQTEDEEDDDA